MKHSVHLIGECAGEIEQRCKIDAAGLSRAFNVPNAIGLTVRLERLVITNAFTNGDGAGIMFDAKPASSYSYTYSYGTPSSSSYSYSSYGTSSSSSYSYGTAGRRLDAPNSNSYDTSSSSSGNDAANEAVLELVNIEFVKNLGVCAVSNLHCPFRAADALTRCRVMQFGGSARAIRMCARQGRPSQGVQLLRAPQLLL